MTLRFVRRSPLFSASVVLLIGLGVGASTLIFTTIDVFLLRPLPVTKPERLARFGVEISATHVNFIQSGIYAQVLAERGQSFESVFTFYPLDAALIAGKHVETITCEVVSDNYFAALGLRPERGAFFDKYTGDSLPAVVTGALWRRAFGGREDVIGSAVRVRGAVFTVVGVMGNNFGGLDLERRADVWVPLSAWKAWTGTPDTRRAPAAILVRLRDGLELSQAEAELRVLYPSIVETYYEGLKGVAPLDVARDKTAGVVLADASQGVSALRKQFSAATGTLLGAIATLLLLVAANVSGLMLARGGARRNEIALRLSLGASRPAIARAVLAESVLLAGAGALLGSLIAQRCGPLLIAFLPSRRPLNMDLTPDLRVLAFTIAATAGVAVLASIAPVLSAVRTDLIQVLGRGGSRLSAPVFGRAFVAVQVALATLLGAGSVSLVRSLSELREQDPGFSRGQLVVAVLDPGIAGVPSQELSRLREEVLRRARELPGAAEASISERPLMRGVGLKYTMGPAGARLTSAHRLNVSLNHVSETHLMNMGMRLIAGRNLVPPDGKAAPRPVVVTESLAREFFPRVDPLGREFGPPGPDGVARARYRIAGVVQDVKYRGMREMAPPTFFTTFGGEEELLTLHVRTRIDAAAMIRQIRTMLGTIGPGLSPLDIATMDQEIETSLWQERMLAAVSEAFAVLAALIAAIGLFGLIAFTLERRIREVGIRFAIGATPRLIAGLLARYASGSVVVGILSGSVSFVLTRRIMQPLLFGQGAGAAVPLVASALLLVFASVAALVVPVVRAIRIQPAIALRDE